MAENRYCVEYAKRGTAGCKKCKSKIEKGLCRIAKIVQNPFTEDGGDMKQWFHVNCVFETFVRARSTTKIIDEPEVLDGWADIRQQDKDIILKLIKEHADRSQNKKSPQKLPAKSKKNALASPSTTKSPATSSKSPGTPSVSNPSASQAGTSLFSSSAGHGSSSGGDRPHANADLEKSKVDNSFRQFRKICAEIAEVGSYLAKTEALKIFLTKGASSNGFEGNTYLWLKLLLPGVVKRVYNIQSKQIAKLFSRIFAVNEDDMVDDLDKGDVAETVRIFFEKSRSATVPRKKSVLSIQEVDELLDQLAAVTKEDDQQRVLTKVASLCTGNDLKMFVRLIKGDLRINAGAKHILDGLNENAYAAFQASRDLKDVVRRVQANSNSGGSTLKVKASLMTPVLPMLAEACRSVDYAFKKCQNGMYAEIKYDGERVQVHKQGNDFRYFSRSLKPVLPHKVAHFKQFIPEAFPHGNDIILDSEVLLIDANTSKPLPFGTLGIHKKQAFNDANVCLFVFDCIHLNGQNLMDKPIKERRAILKRNMKEIPNRIMFSEYEHITQREDLKRLINKTIREGLEGLVLKDVNSVYEPGKRHWLKVKKDYLEKGKMADTADLVCLGAYYGTGNKGGMMSVFLMGTYDAKRDKWCTVTKCGIGFDDASLERLQGQLDMVKISKDAKKVPPWLLVSRQLVPDFVCREPKAAKVWEITGAEFSQSEGHTADGISIRFPRITKERDDKTWKEHTDLARLKVLVKKSKERSDAFDCEGGDNGNDIDDENGGSNGNGDEDGGSSYSGSPVKRRPDSAASSTCSTPRKKLRVVDGSEDGKDVARDLLPSFFNGVRLHIPGEVARRAEMWRYVLAYDGEVLGEEDGGGLQASHVIVTGSHAPTNTNACGQQTMVTEEWVWDCIKTQGLLPTRHYAAD